MNMLFYLTSISLLAAGAWRPLRKYARAYLRNREEKLLRHDAMVANKPIKSIRTISNFTDLSQFHLIWQILAKFSLGPYLLLPKGLVRN